MTQPPRVVVVTRPTPYEELLARHATRRQAEFFLRQRGQTIDTIHGLHHEIHAAVAAVKAAIPLDWRRNHVQRDELDRFHFESGDVIVVVGQDGLVANAAKYLEGQLVIGVNPTPSLFDGVLVRCSVDAGRRALLRAPHGDVAIETRAMVETKLDDGQSLYALNEVFLGTSNHQSARYEIAWAKASARHSSSGIVVATGTGATGWARSIHRQRNAQVALPTATSRGLAFFVREAFPSVATSTEITEGAIDEGDALVVTSRMENGVVFGDGIEADRLRFDWGARAEVRVADRALRLVVG
jgi:NAD kinase